MTRNIMMEDRISTGPDVASRMGSGRSISIKRAVFALIIGAAAAFFRVALIDLIFLFIAAVIIFGIFAMTGASRGVRLMVAIPGGLLCFVMMWFGWLWMETDFLSAIFLPIVFYDKIFDGVLDTVNSSGYVALLGYQLGVEVDPVWMKLFWALESLIFLLLPAIGAWRGVGMGRDAGDDEEIETTAQR
ncbi:MAG: hypothetical protein ABJP02_02465 [Parasphingorhabdus sp.]|uniref:hypothetical protein n=1 Tax=Parasphingorhabdus sp. TaxID=2709688 RepID=UPI003299CF0F